MAVPTPPAPPPAPPGAPEPQAVQDARVVTRRYRKIMRRIGGVFGAVLTAGTLATEPITILTSLIGLGATGLLYRIPPRARVRRARALLLSWEGMQALRGVAGGASPDAAQPLDPRLAAVDAVIARIAEHGAGDPRPGAFAREVREQLARVLEDVRAVELLRGALPAPAGDERVGALRAQVDEKIGRLIGALTEVYQAVLAHDETTLDAVLGRGEEALRQLRARQEVEQLLKR